MAVQFFAGVALSLFTKLGSSFFGTLLGGKQRRPFVPTMLPVPRPQIPSISGLGTEGDETTLAYAWGGPINSESPGLPIPIAGGECRAGLQVINTYILGGEGAYDVLYILFGICEGQVEEAVKDDNPENIWITNEKRLSEAQGAEWESAVGTKDQSVLSWFDKIHQLRQINQEIFEPAKLVINFETTGWLNSCVRGPDFTTQGSLPINSTDKKFGSYSAGPPSSTSDYLSLDYTSDIHLGGDDFTIDFWGYADSAKWTNASNRLYCAFKWQNEGDDTGWGLVLRTTAVGGGTITVMEEFYHHYGGVSRRIAKRSLSMVLNQDQWYHFALERWNGVIRFYVDGVDKTDHDYRYDEAEERFTPAPSSNVAFALFRYMTTMPYSCQGWAGSIDEFRFMNGKAMYKGIDFTPETAAYMPGWTANDGLTFYHSAPVLSALGEADEFNFIVSFPQGLYDNTENDYNHNCRIVLLFRDEDWDADEWGKLVSDVIKNHSTWDNGWKITAGTTSPHRAHLNWRMRALKYDNRGGGSAFTIGETITGGTSSCSAKVCYDYDLGSNTGIVYIGWDEDSDNFQVDEEITGGTSSVTADVDDPEYDPIETGKATYLRKSKYQFKLVKNASKDFQGQNSYSILEYMDEVLNRSLRYPNMALLGLKYPFGGKQTVTTDQLGPMSVLVKRGTQTLPTWPSGTTSRDTSIPAWFCLDCLTNTRWGLGVPIANLYQTDFESWEEFTEGTVGLLRYEGTHTSATPSGTVLTDSGASWVNDELIGKIAKNTEDGSEGVITDNDGTTVTMSGGLSGGSDDTWQEDDTYEIHDAGYRVKWRGLLDSQKDPDESLDIVSGMSRARIIRLGSIRHVSLEKTGSASHLFTVGNIIDGSFARGDIRKDQRSHGYKIWYNDEDKEYRRKSVVYYGPEYNSTSEPLRVPEEFVIGLTNKDQARRMAILRYQLEVFPCSQCTFSAGLDAIGILPGDIAKVIPDSPYSYGGRIVAASTTQVIIDRAIDVSGWGSGYPQIIYRNSDDGTIYTEDIVIPLDTYDNIYHPLPHVDPIGNGGGDTTHPNEVNFFFEGKASGDSILQYDAYAFNASEVRILVNGNNLGYEDASSAWDRKRTVTLPSAYLTSGVNVVTFDNVNNPPSSDVWAVQNIRLLDHPTHGGTLLEIASGTWTENPVLYDVYAVIHRGLAGNPGPYPTEYRILGCERTEKIIHKISCIEYCHDAYFHKDYGTTEL